LSVTAENNQLLALNHEIRVTESALRRARSRRRWSNLSLVFGPALGVVLYGIAWIPHVSGRVIEAVYIPCIPVVLGFCIASAILKSTPGGPGRWRKRPSEDDLELKLAQKREARKHLLGNEDIPTKIRRVEYKEDAFSDIDDLRVESSRYRRVNNLMQAVLIIGSLAATGSSAITGEIPDIRWATLGITFIVGISSGFMGYFKYKERSFYLQQTADAIESEWEAVQVGIGRYKRFFPGSDGKDDENSALAEFVDEVHKLKSEQKKRQQNLEQPPETRHAQDL
jgi:hypothetical protein